MIYLKILFVLVALELIYSLVVYRRISKYSFYTNPRKRLWIFDKERGYKLAPNLDFSSPTEPLENAPRRIMLKGVQTDKFGFRFSGDVETIQDEAKLVFCVGDSTTIGLESTNSKTWPAMLDKHLSPTYRVVNAGVGGYRSIHLLRTVEHLLRNFQPTDIILHTGINDFQYRALPGYREDDVNFHLFRSTISPHPIHNQLIRSFGLYHGLVSLVRWVIRHTGKPPDGRGEKRDPNKLGELNTDPSVWTDELERNVRQICEICSTAGVKLWILLFMTPYYPTEEEQAIAFADVDLNVKGRWGPLTDMKGILFAKLEDIAQDFENVQTVDVSSAFEAKGLHYKERYNYFVDRFHTSEMGNEFMAKTIAAELKNHQTDGPHLANG